MISVTDQLCITVFIITEKNYDDAVTFVGADTEQKTSFLSVLC